MILREALNELTQTDKTSLFKNIPADLLNTEPEQFTPALFSALQKAIEKYANHIPFTSRIGCAREINEACDSFFSSTFAKVCRLDRIFDNTEMDILLLKELQGGSNEALYNQTQADRAERFGMSTNAIQARIHALEDGKEVLGHHVKINIDGRGRAAYDNTIHPIFLTLNLKEVYLLTVAMRQVFAGTAFQNLSVSVSSDIYNQLSEYARSILKPHIDEAGIEYEIPSSDKLIDIRTENRDAIYYLKSSEPCRLKLLDGTAYFGKIKVENGFPVFVTEDGEILPLPNNPDTYDLEAICKS